MQPTGNNVLQSKNTPAPLCLKFVISRRTAKKVPDNKDLGIVQRHGQQGGKKRHEQGKKKRQEGT